MPTRVVSGQGRATAARGQGSATAGRGPPGRATSGRGPPDRTTAACRPGRQQHADKAGQQQPADEVGLGTTAARKSYIPSGYIKSGFVIDDELFASRAGDVEAKARRGGGTRGGGGKVPTDMLNPLLEKLMDQCCSTKDSSVDGGDKIVT